MMKLWTEGKDKLVNCLAEMAVPLGDCRFAFNICVSGNAKPVHFNGKLNIRV